nr:AMP-binding protein [Paracoccus haematequi]
MDADLAMLLSTSGTTGAVKLVRLSGRNIHSNALAIADYLEIGAQDTAITTLPLHYSYGMSVLNSYLAAGARLVLTEESVTADGFWAQARGAGVTSLALVPTQFELLDKIGFQRATLPSLRYVTQAGGRLDPILAQRFAHAARAEGWQLVIMYGQTEASPRIAYVPPEAVLDNVQSIGRAIPGGRLWIENGQGHPIEDAGIAGELVYQGPNVMMGLCPVAHRSGPARRAGHPANRRHCAARDQRLFPHHRAGQPLRQAVWAAHRPGRDRDAVAPRRPPRLCVWR